MSEANVEIVRKAWEALGRGDLEAAFDVHAPDVELDLANGTRVDADVYHGLEGTRRAWVYAMREASVARIQEFDTQAARPRSRGALISR